MKKFLIGLGALAVVLIAFAFSLGTAQDQTLGNKITTILERFSAGVEITGGLKTDIATTTSKMVVGASGSPLAQLLQGTCTLTVNTSSTAVTASTTGAFDCPVTSAKFGDHVWVTMSTTTVSTLVGGWNFRWAGASTTDGYITVGLYNSTGANATPTLATRQNVQYLIIR